MPEIKPLSGWAELGRWAALLWVSAGSSSRNLGGSRCVSDGGGPVGEEAESRSDTPRLRQLIEGRLESRCLNESICLLHYIHLNGVYSGEKE